MLVGGISLLLYCQPDYALPYVVLRRLLPWGLAYFRLTHHARWAFTYVRLQFQAAASLDTQIDQVIALTTVLQSRQIGLRSLALANHFASLSAADSIN